MLTATLRLPQWRLPKLDREHWMGSGVLAVAACLYLVAGASVTSLAGVSDGTANAKTRQVATAEAAAKAAPPAAEPLQFKAVPKSDAVAYNASIPVSTLANPAARPFVLPAASAEHRVRALECLTAAVYYEAATETADGQRAVAQVVLNRVRHPAYPNSVCGVVFEGAERSTGCQFTFTCDGSIARAPHPGFWARAKAVAEAALAGKVYAPVGWSTHYHTNWVVPYWSSSLVKAANVGTHIFYRWEGGWGRAPAFTNRHSGAEPLLAKMRHIGFASAPAEAIVTAEGEAIPVPGEAPAADLAATGGSYDPKALDRAIVRRFVPADREGVATTLAKQNEGQTVPDSLRWALTGEGKTGEALGKKPAAPAATKPVS